MVTEELVMLVDRQFLMGSGTPVDADSDARVVNWSEIHKKPLD